MLSFENIRTRYLAGWIRDDQMERYVELGVITREKAQEIQSQRSEMKR